MKDSDQSAVQQLRRHFERENTYRSSQFPILSSPNRATHERNEDGKFGKGRDENSDEKDRRTNQSVSSRAKTSLPPARLDQRSLLATNESKRQQTNTLTAASLPSILEKSGRTHQTSSSNAQTINDSQSGVLVKPFVKSEPNLRCKRCGSVYHKTSEHFDNDLAEKESRRRVGHLKSQRKKRRTNHKKVQNHVNSHTRAKDHHKTKDASEVKSSKENLPPSNDDDKQHDVKEISVKDKSVTTHRYKSSFSPILSSTGKEDLHEDNAARNDKVFRSVFYANNNKRLEKSKSLLHQNQIKNDKKRDITLSRSSTIHDISDERSKTETTNNLRNPSRRKEHVLPNNGVSAYRSMSKIPTRENGKGKQRREGSNSASAKSKRLKSSSSQDKNGKSPYGRYFVSMNELAKYRDTMNVYLDSKWKTSRQNRFYNRLEDAQIKQRKEKRSAQTNDKKKTKETRETQLEQLQYIRDKHQRRRNMRLSTQHVKWKYVLSGVGGDSDRKQYGLPSEYYTYYGFAPPDKNGWKKDIHIEMPSSRKTKSASRVHKTGADELLPSEDEIAGLRRRNKERYDHIFRTRSRTELDIVQKIIRNGHFTVEIEEGDKKHPNYQANTNPTSDIKSAKSVPKLQKRTSTLVVKNVVNEAMRILEALEESDPEGHSSDVQD